MSQGQQAGGKLGATPGKLALVAVLGLVLVGVVASNWPSGDTLPITDTTEESPEAPETAAAASAASPGAATVAAGPFGEFAEDRNWPERPLREVTSYDPLAATEWIKPPQSAAGPIYNEQQVNELLAAENAIIFVAGDKRIARIGNQEFQVGDSVGRYTISDITAKGVVLHETE